MGAYEGGSGCGEVLPGLLQQLQRHAIHCRVRLFCCGALNTSADGQPLAQGLSYHTGVCTCHCPPPGSPPGTSSLEMCLTGDVEVPGASISVVGSRIAVKGVCTLNPCSFEG